MIQVAKKQDNTVDIAGEYLLPEGITISTLVDFWNMANDEYANPRKRMQLLDGADRGELWKTITAKFPKYQVLPETNHVNYIKENLLASIYTVGKYAELQPRSQEQVQYCSSVNSVLDAIWENLEVYKYQRKAGERASLINLGVTQVGWSQAIIGGTTNYLTRGDVVLKNINPLKYMRDPYADCQKNGRFTLTWDEYHITAIKSVSVYKERLDTLIKAYGENIGTDTSALAHEAQTMRATNNKAQNKYHTLQQYWVKYNEGGKEKIAEIHLLDNRFVLYCNKDIKPSVFPFAELYCNEPGDDLIGVSEPAKIFKNYITYNMLNSIIATHAYKAQRPPRFVNIQSGINLRQFAMYGADADKTFPVNGDASMAVHYGKFPDLPPTIDVLISKLEFDIKDKSGVNAVYAGQDTGSIQTTGGMDTMMSRATGRDEVKIQLYEEYSKTLTDLIIKFYVLYGNKRTYAVKDKTSNKITNVPVDFKKIPDDFNYNKFINIQSSLPRNKMRLAQAANILLEKQAQYKASPELITMEEWLLFQDIPFKDLIMERLNIQRNNNMTEQVTQILFQFAGLIESGMDPEEALTQVTASMEQTQNPEAQLALGNTGGAQNFQDAQAGNAQGDFQ